MSTLVMMTKGQVMMSKYNGESLLRSMEGQCFSTLLVALYSGNLLGERNSIFGCWHMQGTTVVHITPMLAFTRLLAILSG